MKSQIYEEPSTSRTQAPILRQKERKDCSPFQLFLGKFKKQRTAVFAFWMLIGIFTLGLIGPWITPYDPNRPVNEQYAEKGMDLSKQTSGVVSVMEIMSDGTQRVVSDVAAQSMNRLITSVKETGKDISITPTGHGSTSIVISKGDVSTRIKVEVSADDSTPVLTQLLLSSPSSKINKGDNFQIGVQALLSNGKKLNGLDEIRRFIAASPADSSTQSNAGNGFLSGKKKTNDSQLLFQSLNGEVLQVNQEGVMTALAKGIGEVKVSLGPVTSVLPVAVETDIKEPVLIQLVPSQAEISLRDSSKHQPPSTLHWFGTDHQNRDIFSRVLAGTRETLFIGFVSVGFGAVIGTLLGLIAGYYGRWIDSLITRFTDILLAFPGILLAIAVIAVLGAGMVNIIFAVAVFTIPIFIRIVRGSTLSLKQMTYVEAAKSIGVRDFVIIVRHILPGMFPVVIVYLTMRIGTAILLGAALSFLGLGGDITAPEWGAMLSAAKDNSRGIFYPTFFPGIAIVLTVVSFNLLGDGLRDTLDPKLKD
ncbi:ABC transporter permease [Brevibacillus ginsengisoli]|uniref:ABC transporter permease n=1 Tax=Brevibacillus ginsengisoli TaxID=363854 RepID=UPI003CEE6CB4